MPNPAKFKSVGLANDAYVKLKYIADQEDRPMGRQLVRIIEDYYDEMEIRKENERRGYKPLARRRGIGGASELL